MACCSVIWRDERLAFPVSSPECAEVGNITLDVTFGERLWTPNVCIVNSKSASVSHQRCAVSATMIISEGVQIHESPTRNMMLILYANGSVWQNNRMRVTGPCDIDLRSFPFDEQACRLVDYCLRCLAHFPSDATRSCAP